MLTSHFTRELSKPQSFQLSQQPAGSSQTHRSPSFPWSGHEGSNQDLAIMSHTPSLNRKPSMPWDRLKPIKQDSLDAYGFVSRGDDRLLSIKAQENYYHKITSRYMLFCSQHSKNLGEAFQTLTVKGQGQTSNVPPDTRSNGPSMSLVEGVEKSSEAAEQLSHILNALRKLREAILATKDTAATPIFAQKVHVFNIRLAILALHPESYHASLRYLLSSLQTVSHPLVESEQREMVWYLILDTALRQEDFNEAYRIRSFAHRMGLFDKRLNQILVTVSRTNWSAFWDLHNRVDGYVRALMHWKLDSLRLKVLKTIGRSYLKCDVDFVLRSTTNGQMTWNELVEKEGIAWTRDGNTVTIRKPKQLAKKA